MLVVNNNDSFERSWQYVDASETAVDVTGAKCSFIIYDSADNNNVVFACNELSFIEVTGSEGLFECIIPAQYFQITPGDYMFVCKAVLNPTTVKQIVLLENDYIYVRQLSEAL